MGYGSARTFANHVLNAAARDYVLEIVLEKGGRPSHVAHEDANNV